MSRLISGRTKHDCKTVVCLSCLHPFSNHGALDAHAPCCTKHTPQKIIYPDAKNKRDCTLEFRAYRKQHRVPFYLVSDLESFWKPVSGDDESFSRQVSDDDDRKSATKIIDEHCVSGFACYRVTDHEQYQTEPTVYSGPDDMKKFYEHVMCECDELGRRIKAGLDMTPLTPQEQSIYDAATVCGNFDKAFTSAKWKETHHCHVSGQFMFAARNNCNLQLKMTKRRKYHESVSDKRSRCDTDLSDNDDSEVDGDDAADS